MARSVLAAVGVVALYLAALWTLRASLAKQAVHSATVRALDRARRVQLPWSVPQPPGRPLELIAHDARRLGNRFRNPPRGTSFAKLEASRRAYDHVLGEACRAMGVEHLLMVLPPGDELDVERARVEGLLWLAGMRIDEAA
jgi:hypothetical protein